MQERPFLAWKFDLALEGLQDCEGQDCMARSSSQGCPQNHNFHSGRSASSSMAIISVQVHTCLSQLLENLLFTHVHAPRTLKAVLPQKNPVPIDYPRIPIFIFPYIRRCSTLYYPVVAYNEVCSTLNYLRNLCYLKTEVPAAASCPQPDRDPSHLMHCAPIRTAGNRTREIGRGLGVGAFRALGVSGARHCRLLVGTYLFGEEMRLEEKRHIANTNHNEGGV